MRRCLARRRPKGAVVSPRERTAHAHHPRPLHWPRRCCWRPAAARRHRPRRLVKGPFKTGPDVTQGLPGVPRRPGRRLHEDRPLDLVLPRRRSAGRSEAFGKINSVNNFCIALPSNEPRCTSCHAGYGWKDATFDFTKAENVDCLVCHDTTGTYRKFPTGAGHPAYEDDGVPAGSGKTWPAVDLEKVGQERRPNQPQHLRRLPLLRRRRRRRQARGPRQLASSSPTREQDVHMAVDGANMTCTSCHRSSATLIPGKALLGLGRARRGQHARLRRLPRREGRTSERRR